MEIKNCPFCGKQPAAMRYEILRTIKIYLTCETCEFSMHEYGDDSIFTEEFVNNFLNTKEKLISKWNTREGHE